MQNIGLLKRGDTFAFTVAITDKTDDAPLVGAEDKLKCQGRYAPDGKLILDLTCRETEVTGTYEFRTADTGEIRDGQTIYFDIEYTEGDVTVSTETFAVTAVGDYTYD